MSYRNRTIIPLLLAVVALIQGLVQLGIYTYFHQLAFSPATPFFAETYAPLWAGAWTSIAGLTLIFVLSTSNGKEWRRVRSVTWLLYLSIFAVQSASWTLCEVLEFRYWLVAKDPDSTVTARRFVGAYISSTAASVIGVTVATCGFAYVLIVFYRLARVFFLYRTPPPRPIQTSTLKEGRGGRTVGRTGASSAPPAVHTAARRGAASQTADSWHFLRFRSSTPKAKTDMVRRRRPTGDGKSALPHRRRRNSLFESSRPPPPPRRDSIAAAGLDISQEEFQMPPLRAIAAIHPNAYRFDDLKSPPLEECAPETNNNIDEAGGDCDRSTTTAADGGGGHHQMSSFFDEGGVQHLIRAPRDHHPEPPPRSTTKYNFESIPEHSSSLPKPPPPPPVRSESIHASIGRRPSSRKFAMPTDAWRLPPIIPKSRVAKVLDFSGSPESGLETSRTPPSDENDRANSIVVNRL